VEVAVPLLNLFFLLVMKLKELVALEVEVLVK
jgi:hypothetical protein